MLINTYVYKGPHNSLLAPCVIGILKVPDADYENRIPGISTIYQKRNNLNEFSDIIVNLNYGMSTLTGMEINSKGDMIIKDRINRLTLKYYAEAVTNKDVCFIKQLKSPRLWHERLLVMMTVMYRHVMLKSQSSNDIDLLELDCNYKKHLQVIANYKFLPPIYNWEKTMATFKNVFPRPLWYTKELQTIENINRGL